MKTTKMYQPPPYEVTDKVFCDICSAQIQEDQGTEHEKVTIEHEKGSMYGDSGHMATIKIDMCGKCFKLWLLPLVEQQSGRKMERTETSW